MARKGSTIQRDEEGAGRHRLDMKAKATVHGAVSIVNAIATGRGATLGTEQQVTATAEASPGRGITLESDGRSTSSRLISRTVKRVMPKKTLEKSRIAIRLESDIPAGYGLKSSSAISSAVALACARLLDSRIDDRRVLQAGVNASMEAGVSMTGAYDDACACYYGGFNVTDNRRKRLIRHERGPRNMAAVIFIPRGQRRGNPKRLRALETVFEKAWGLARDGDYWDAMTLNGLAASAALGTDPRIITDLLEGGAVAASVSGNGPAIAAVARGRDLARIRKVFSHGEGRTVVTGISNKKAQAHLL